jgi:hypothetical protein
MYRLKVPKHPWKIAIRWGNLGIYFGKSLKHGERRGKSFTKILNFVNFTNCIILYIETAM